jgi:U3 small nucleolar ribonucleoprotein protein IMP3
MVRKLKHHEQKLLRKVDFNTYKSDGDHRDATIMRRYGLQRRDDYTKYNRLAGSLRQLAHRIAALEPNDEFRRRHEELLLSKLWDMGVLGTGGGGGYFESN